MESINKLKPGSLENKATSHTKTGNFSTSLHLENSKNEAYSPQGPHAHQYQAHKYLQNRNHQINHIFKFSNFPHQYPSPSNPHQHPLLNQNLNQNQTQATHNQMGPENEHNSVFENTEVLNLHDKTHTGLKHQHRIASYKPNNRINFLHFNELIRNTPAIQSKKIDHDPDKDLGKDGKDVGKNLNANVNYSGFAFGFGSREVSNSPQVNAGVKKMQHAHKRAQTADNGTNLWVSYHGSLAATPKTRKERFIRQEIHHTQKEGFDLNDIVSNSGGSVKTHKYAGSNTKANRMLSKTALGIRSSSPSHVCEMSTQKVTSAACGVEGNDSSVSNNNTISLSNNLVPCSPTTSIMNSQFENEKERIKEGKGDVVDCKMRHKLKGYPKSKENLRHSRIPTFANDRLREQSPNNFHQRAQTAMVGSMISSVKKNFHYALKVLQRERIKENDESYNTLLNTIGTQSADISKLNLLQPSIEFNYNLIIQMGLKLGIQMASKKEMYLLWYVCVFNLFMCITRFFLISFLGLHNKL